MFSSLIAILSEYNKFYHRAMFHRTSIIFRHLAVSLTRQRTNLLVSKCYFSSELTASWPEELKSFLDKEKLTEPTRIQEKTLPIAMENKNLVGVARTGSGKTLAFVIPAVMKILKARKEAEPSSEYQHQSAKCLVLAPTRELAGQINDVFYKFHHMKIKSIPLVGGSSRSAQIRDLDRTNYDVYVATPGRLTDLVEANIVSLSKIQYLVLDEADRMLDMGFEPQIRKIIQLIPKNRQTLMWSATWPQEVQSLAREFLDNYEYIAIDSDSLKANPNIKQIVKVCPPRSKFELLLNSIDDFKMEHEQPKMLIFVNTKRLAEMLMVQLMRRNIRAISMHGDRTQRQRDDALNMFRSRRCNTLVATDVAARGLDINDITHVVNYDFPKTIEDYIHRIGRTARHEKNGTALSFFTENDASLATKLIEVLKETNQEIPNQLEKFTKSHMYKRNNFASRY